MLPTNVAKNDPFQLRMMKMAVNHAEETQGFTAHTQAAHSMYVVCPIKELVGRGAEEQVYNTAVLIGRDGGVIGRYRKRFSFWGFPEDPPPTGGHGGRRQQGTELEPPPVFDLDFGRVAILICFDINFNELWMHLAARGVDVVLWPSMYPAGELISALARVFKKRCLLTRCAKSDGFRRNALADCLAGGWMLQPAPWSAFVA